MNRIFAEFYKEQVLAGNIKKDTYGKDTVGVFYNSDKPYLEPTTLLATKDRDLYSPAGKQEAKDILRSLPDRIVNFNPITIQLLQALHLSVIWTFLRNGKKLQTICLQTN
ncbi:hypothetical protein [Leptospira vanthielii]|uniref:hypothetical protein n=1 Tax=Leptospira vanthielii TaxID=293085 RepID=UPI0012F8BFBC|nr:hypothetical protein [Leptospira vanthielii]